VQSELTVHSLIIGQEDDMANRAVAQMNQSEFEAMLETVVESTASLSVNPPTPDNADQRAAGRQNGM
jgi:hypothetical protein